MSRRDESGAIAVIVALLAVVLLGIAAFVADFGLAFANKRQLQTAADAAALGAAGVLAEQPGHSCSDILASGGTDASAEAQLKVDANEPASVLGTLTYVPPDCGSSEVLVKATVTGTSPNLFGGIFGDDDGYEVFRSAAAVVEAAGTVGAGLRPLAICSKDVTSLTTFPSPVMKLEGPGRAARALDCPDAGRAGNWWTLDCPEDSGHGDLADNVANGCSDPVDIVPEQPAPPSVALPGHLLTYCANPDLHPESCLGSNPGNVRDHNSDVAFQGLVTSGETIYLPVFCGQPSCSPGAISVDGGGNVIYPVHRLIAVQLCGYHFGNRKSSASDMHGDCASANNPSNLDPNDGDNHDNYILVSVQQVQVSGGTTPSGCKIGAPCDTGLRQVRMVAGGFDY